MSASMLDASAAMSACSSIGGASSSATEIRPEHIVVHDTRFNYGKGDKNPLEQCLFYGGATLNGAS